MKNSLTIKYYLNFPKTEKELPKIYLRITFNRLKAEFSTGLSIDKDEWDLSKMRGKKNNALNEELIFIENKILDIRRQLAYNNKPISAKIIRDIYTGNDRTHILLLQYFDEYVNKIKKQTEEFSKGTVSNYNTTYKHLKNFIKSKSKNDLPLNEMDYSFINDFDYYLITQSNSSTEKIMKRNAANKQHQRLKAICSKASKEGLLKKNPYDSFNLKFTKSHRTFLSEDELDKLKKHTLANNKSLEKVRDIFLFSVYSGLRFGDATNLKTNHIIKDKKGKYWIELIQEKTGERFEIPVLKNAMSIIEKYDNEERKITGYILPRISHQKVNVYLKTIAEIVGIEKELTHHVARHTFATTVTLSNDVPLEIVSKLLGHNNIRTTQIYAKITNKYLSKITDKLNKKL